MQSLANTEWQKKSLSKQTTETMETGVLYVQS